MNDKFYSDRYDTSPDDQVFDKLAEGELSDAEYRRLLASLDDEPSGWRRCAMAFLEAQTLEREFGSLASETKVVGVASAEPVVAGRRNTGLKRTASWFSLAVGLLLAFGFGAIAHSTWWPVDPTNPAPSVVAQQSAENSDHDQNVSVQHVVQKPSIEPSGRITLVVNHPDSKRRQKINVPVFPYEELNKNWLKPREIPLELVLKIKQTGHEVRRQQEFYPVTLGDGRRVVIPVEQIEIVPVNSMYYQ